MKKPYSKFMDDRIVKILEKGIKAGEVQETIAMIDALLLHYTENGIDIDGDDDSEAGITITYGAGQGSTNTSGQSSHTADDYINDDPNQINNTWLSIEDLADLIRIAKQKDMQQLVDFVEEKIVEFMEDE